MDNMTTREKLYDIVLTLSMWILIGCIFEYFTPGDIKESSLNIYMGACLGYIVCMFTAKFKRKRKGK